MSVLMEMKSGTVIKIKDIEFSRLKQYTIQDNEKKSEHFILQLDPVTIRPLNLNDKLKLSFQFASLPEWTNPYEARPLSNLNEATVDTALHGRLIEIKRVPKDNLNMYFSTVGIMTTQKQIDEVALTQAKFAYDSKVVLYLTWLLL